jgi:hypothetical protein
MSSLRMEKGSAAGVSKLGLRPVCEGGSACGGRCRRMKRAPAVVRGLAPQAPLASPSTTTGRGRAQQNPREGARWASSSFHQTSEGRDSRMKDAFGFVSAQPPAHSSTTTKNKPGAAIPSTARDLRATRPFEAGPRHLTPAQPLVNRLLQVAFPTRSRSSRPGEDARRQRQPQDRGRPRMASASVCRKRAASATRRLCTAIMIRPTNAHDLHAPHRFWATRVFGFGVSDSESACSDLKFGFRILSPLVRISDRVNGWDLGFRPLRARRRRRLPKVEGVGRCFTLRGCRPGGSWRNYRH